MILYTILTLFFLNNFLNVSLINFWMFFSYIFECSSHTFLNVSLLHLFWMSCIFLLEISFGCPFKIPFGLSTLSWILNDFFLYCFEWSHFEWSIFLLSTDLSNNIFNGLFLTLLFVFSFGITFELDTFLFLQWILNDFSFSRVVFSEWFSILQHFE